MGAALQASLLGPSFLFIKALVYLYTLLTLPVYFILSQPWRKWKKAAEPIARALNPGDPGTVYERVQLKESNPFKSFTTADQYFRGIVARYPDNPSFGTRELIEETWETQPDGKVFRKVIQGDYSWITYREADAVVEQLALSLQALGVQPRQPVVVFAETRVEWMLLAQACFRVNVPVVGLFPSLGSDGIRHALLETECTYLFTSRDQIAKLKDVISDVPSVRHVIYMEGLTVPETSDFPKFIEVQSYSEFLRLGTKLKSELRHDQSSFEGPTAEDAAIIVYTSGSTGVPKGVVLSHRQIMAVVYMVYNSPASYTEKDVYIAYLPIAHVFEFCLELGLLGAGMRIGYSSPFTLLSKSTAIRSGHKGDIELLCPTLFAAVPIVLEKFRKSVLENVEARGQFFWKFFNFCYKYKLAWSRRGFTTPLLDRLIFKKLRDVFGGRMVCIAIGGAPIGQETFDFCRMCICCDISNFCGQTETGGCGIFSSVHDPTGNTDGYAGAGVYIRLMDWEEGGYSVRDKPYPRGELLIGGDCVATGYFKRPDLTQETFFEENGIRWVRSGDVAEIDPASGRVRILDRKKDLIKLQHGEYISLGKVEAYLKSCPLVDNICCVGDSRRDFLVALVVPAVDQLRSLARDFHLDSNLSFKELCSHPRLIAHVAETIEDHGYRTHLQRFEIPQRVHLVPDEWLPDSGLVTASLKLKRPEISRRYRQQIEAMYNGTFRTLRPTTIDVCSNGTKIK